MGSSKKYKTGDWKPLVLEEVNKLAEIKDKFKWRK